LLLIAIFADVAMLSGTAWADTVAEWDFSQGLQGWWGNTYVADLTVSRQGLAFQSTGIDPWIEGPAVDLPGTGLTRVRVRMKSQADRHGELFYGPTFRAGHSVRFTVNDDGQWHEYSLLIREPLGRGTRFRLDPAAGEGHIVVERITVESIPPVPSPPFERPERPDETNAQPFSISSGELIIDHYRRGWGDFTVRVGDREMAAGYRKDLIGVMLNGEIEWLKLSEAAFSAENMSVVHALIEDRAGAKWRITRRFHSEEPTGAILVETTIVVDEDREAVYIPWLTLFPGLGTFGERKTQGLLAGLEYLSDEPSSSEADITTPEHVRRVPDPIKITFPLMAVAADGCYIGLIWEPSALAAATFDSPDRVYNSGGHLMALTGPAVGENRFENDLVAHTPIRLLANQPVTVTARIVGGSGETVIPAVRKYVECEGLPGIPEFEGGFDAAVSLMAHGWLDSAINEDGLFRHAVWGESFKAAPASDAPAYMDWLANYAAEPDLVDRLLTERDLAVSRWPRGQLYMGMVSHTRTPTAPLVFGGIEPYVERRRADAESLLAHFDEQGVRPYRPGDVDYGKTHFANHANGHAAAEVVSILEAATLSADPALIERGLALLDKQTVLYANTVPRGAQTWEVPLHTPDILASAYLVKAYALGYILSGNPEHLEQARYWAWTGVPFVYLVNPTEGEVGPYATIPVLGATNWQAPIWFGLPVQWCGLVYGSALHLLSQYDTGGPWDTIARGITATGLQMTWPTSDGERQGLLPDFFELRAQHRDGPAINPGTVQTRVPELFGRGALYDVRKLATTGWFVHAPCAIRDLEETQDAVAFTVDGWNGKTFTVLLSGVATEPTHVMARSRGTAQFVPAPIHFSGQQGLLDITLQHPSEIQVSR